MCNVHESGKPGSPAVVFIHGGGPGGRNPVPRVFIAMTAYSLESAERLNERRGPRYSSASRSIAARRV